MIIKKIFRRIKGRIFAYRRKYHVFKTKEHTITPDVAIDSLFLSCVIDSKENKCVKTLDIPGDFMQSDTY